MALGLLGREHATLHELGNERVVGRELLERAAAQEVRARVADVADGDLACRLVDERCGHRRTHAARRGIGDRALPDPAVRLLDERHDAVLALGLGAGFLEGGCGEPCRHLACPRAAHPVGDGEERRPEDVGVLVRTAPAPRVRGRGRAPDPHCCTWSSVAPILITSPTRASFARFSFVPFRNVPLVDPRSSIQAPSGRGSIRA